MKIELSKIKPSPNPIRKTWDEEKMQELAQSIKEQGMIVPIKVRPDNGGYEVVYGHRRLEAARRAGFNEIEAVIEKVDDTNTLIQSLIENVVREDMSPKDKANALKALMEQTGWNYSEVGRRGIMSRIDANRLGLLLNFPVEIQDKVGGDDKPLSLRHIVSIGAVDTMYQLPVLKKAADEKLTIEQTHKVAESIAATKDPRRREALLNTPYSSFIHDPEINRERAEKYGAYDPLSNKHDVSKSDQWQNSPEVVALYDYLLSVEKYAPEVIKMDELGKFAPEARPFTIRKIQRMIGEWEKVIKQLGSEK